MSKARAVVRLGEVDRVGVVRREDRPDQAVREEREEGDARDHRGAVPQVAVPRVPPEARAADRRARISGRRRGRRRWRRQPEIAPLLEPAQARELGAFARRGARHQRASRVRGSRMP